MALSSTKKRLKRKLLLNTGQNAEENPITTRLVDTFRKTEDVLLVNEQNFDWSAAR